ncbi:MAG: NGG1p interacting factor NIF3 [Patescibacteria group bacterium]|nr:NGG1p interacting factor NIF3 [Patescibacteria group bacterium]
MTIQEIYDLAIQMGIKADPRGVSLIKKILERNKKAYQELKEKDKKYFDKESLKNPYADSRIVSGDPKTPVKKILAGIDIDVGEVLLADRLNQKGEKIDLLFGHHPHGAALASLDEVMDLQIDLMASFGVPVNIAEALLSERISQVKRGVNPSNHFQSIDAAKLLDFPFICVHTAFDNLGSNFLTNYLAKKDLETVGDVVDAIEEIPEFSEAKEKKAGPMITAGSRKNRAGRVVVSGFTGGTGGSKLIYEKLAHAGVGTVIEMHMNEAHFEEAKKHHLNVIISGHMASDSLGINIFFDELEKRGIKIIPCSGFIRVNRIKKTSRQ